MAPAHPSQKEDEEDLAAFELPFLHRLVVQLWAMVLGLITRLTDAVLLVGRPALVRPYVGLWLAERLRSPYRARRSFEVVLALRATGQRMRELIYGETPLMSALWVFRRAGVGPGSRVVDLGAGRGRVLLAARWLGAEARGVELLAEHVTRMAHWLAPAGITLVQGDAAQADVLDATHVFTNWLALTPETKARLVARLRTCAPGTRVLTVLHPIEAEDFVRLSSHRVLFTWGLERVWLHEYRPSTWKEVAVEDVDDEIGAHVPFGPIVTPRGSVVAKPIKMTVQVYSLFAVNNSPQSRWGSATSHPVANAKVELEGTGLSATVGRFGQAQFDVSSLSSGDYVLSLTPHADNLLRNSGGPVEASDGNSTDKAGTCRYRPLKIQVSLQINEDSLKLGVKGPCDGATHGAAFFQLPASVVIDWKPDWVACNSGGARPPKTSPTFIILHRTDSATPGSSLDEFIPSNQHKASHYLVDVDGHIIKLVHEERVANHGGISWWGGKTGLSSISVGIEIVNKSGPFTPQQYDAIARIIRDLHRQYPGITRHNILAHGDIRVKQTKEPKNLELAERAGCPGFTFEWTRLAEAGLSTKADASLFKDSQIDEEYGGYFKDNPAARIPLSATDEKLLRKDKTPYGVIATLQTELASLGYSINAQDGKTPTGKYDAPTQAAVDRFRRRFVPGSVRSNLDVSPIFDRPTAIALKRVLLDRQR